MIKHLFLSLFLCCALTAKSQCISGDCVNGTGKYDFIFAVYSGEFKKGKPHGKGTMDYGKGEKFVGNFIDGKEDGEGIYYKNNTSRKVIYILGKELAQNKQIIVEGNIPKIDGCLIGNCFNGYGEILFASGNIYKGNFKDGSKEGKGTMFFASGNVIEANFKNNLPTEGQFKYAKEGTIFKGTFNNDAQPQTGEYTYANFNAKVTIVNGLITKVDNPVARRADSTAKADRDQTPTACGMCAGKGFSGGGKKTSYNEEYITTTYVDSGGGYIKSTSARGNVSRVSYVPIAECSQCRGTGKIVKDPNGWKPYTGH